MSEWLWWRIGGVVLLGGVVIAFVWIAATMLADLLVGRPEDEPSSRRVCKVITFEQWKAAKDAGAKRDLLLDALRVEADDD